MSNTNWSPELVDKTRKSVFAKAAADADYRKLCLTDAAEAIKQVSGVAPPANAPKIRFVESMDEMVFVLPPAGAEASMSDEDLERVAGGCTLIPYSSMCGAGSK